jgi:hypothetical protein
VKRREIECELRRLEQRFIDAERSHALEQNLLKEQFNEYKEVVRAKHTEMNEVRRQINDERGQFELRERADVQFGNLFDRQARLENNFANFNGRLAGLGIGLTIIMFLMELAFKFWAK